MLEANSPLRGSEAPPATGKGMCEVAIIVRSTAAGKALVARRRVAALLEALVQVVVAAVVCAGAGGWVGVGGYRFPRQGCKTTLQSVPQAPS